MSGSEPPVVACGVCKKQPKNAHLLPCLHAFCLSCLQDECTQNSRDKFFCPLCVTSSEDRKSHPARPWHAFEQFLEAEEIEEGRRKRREELPASESARGTRDEDWHLHQSEDSDEEEWMTSSVSTQPQTFPCPSHPDKMAETFCGKCQQAACEKCVSVFHRRCQPLRTMNEAVEASREDLDRLHARLADSMVQCQLAQDIHTDRLNAIEEMRRAALLEIKSQRVELMNIILAKEKLLTDEINAKLNEMSQETRAAETSARTMVGSLSAQLSVLDLSLSARGEGELLSYLPSLSHRLQPQQQQQQGTLATSDSGPTVHYTRSDQCLEALRPAVLGSVSVNGPQGSETDDQIARGEASLTLTPVISFHGGCRDDMCDPLLTDLLLLANGDVILTDRDNKCVKKFNNSGKLLTRVVMEAVPSRIASVSQSRAVVSAMNKKALYFLSLHGTVRFLSFARVRKIYSFLTSVGDGVLAAGTNQCDSIDLITDKGQLLRQLYAQRPDRASIARPLYLAVTIPPPHRAVSYAHHKESSHRSTTTTTSATDAISDNTSNGTSSSNNNNNKNTNNKNINKNKNSSKNSSSSGNTDKLDPTNLNNRRRSSAAASPSAASNAAENASKTPDRAADVKIPDLLVSDSGKRILFRLTSEGAVTSTLKSTESLTLECPLGVTVHESGQVLLADRDADSILQLDASGCFVRKLLTSEQGLSKPCGLVAGHRGQVALSQVDGMIKIYRSEVTYGHTRSS
ncbi:uncharacterized protein LOC101857504 [Aplysia californica]|uniref:Uncharacterized protein LOC101857504 n=1 Tax=Aplysia californica TaxID=6500 RepID=A0ABM0JY92_APLCA|nr:uncharacterized protein LOC101857504 [Aplysia californica]XP_005104383.1 uncharacterized protein LOC101857504 [Aplysia californica]